MLLKKDKYINVFYSLKLDYYLKLDEKQATGPTGLILNPAEFYSDQYPAIFNILFWTTLLIALAIYGIVYGMYSMDPGLDTVIYRMTSQRVKKEQQIQ